jgi:hypothetical protein
LKILVIIILKAVIDHKKSFFFRLNVTASRSSGDIHFLNLLCFSIYDLILCRMYQNISDPIFKYAKNFDALVPAALGTKYETRHTSLFHKKLGSPNRFSRSLITIFSTKGFLTVVIVHPF